MKKFLLITIFGLVLSSMCISCEHVDKDINITTVAEKPPYRIDIITIEGHKYIHIRKGVWAGNCIIHAESCECKNDSNYNK